MKKLTFEEEVKARIKTTQSEIYILEKEICCKLAFIEALEYSINLKKECKEGAINEK